MCNLRFIVSSNAYRGTRHGIDGEGECFISSITTIMHRKFMSIHICKRFTIAPYIFSTTPIDVILRNTFWRTYNSVCSVHEVGTRGGAGMQASAKAMIMFGASKRGEQTAHRTREYHFEMDRFVLVPPSTCARCFVLCTLICCHRRTLLLLFPLWTTSGIWMYFILHIYIPIWVWVVSGIW